MPHIRPTAKHVRHVLMFLIIPAVSTATGAAFAQTEWKSGIVWPQPPVVDPGPEGKTVGSPPPGAIVLFDGKDLSQWHGGRRWLVADGVATSRGGSISTKQSFGDCRVHVEWASPSKVSGHGQGRGNSGVYMMGKYEVQILDSYNNETYFDGQAGAIYKQSPPMVNACRGPGRWQTFDVVFRAPRFNKDGSLQSPAALTVLHNGMVVQNNFQLLGETAWHKPPEYEAHPAKLPIMLQFHGNPVRFRNIWVRELKPIVGKKPEKAKDGKTDLLGCVTLDGKPLSGAVIAFHGSTGKPISTTINDKGRYKLKPLPAGVYKITFKAAGDSAKKIPHRYTQAETSGLVVEVSPQVNAYDFNLSSR